MLNPSQPAKQSYLTKTLTQQPGVFVAASDYMKALPDTIRPWVPGAMLTLGTDGFGRSETRAALRDFFEVDSKHIVWAALVLLFRDGQIDATALAAAQTKLKIDPAKADPAHS